MNIKKRFSPQWSTFPVRICCAVLALVLAAGGYLGITSALDPYDCRMVEGVTIGALEVGGLTKRETRKALKTALADSLESQPMIIRLPEDNLILYPEDTDVCVSLRKTVNAAYSFGRDEESIDPKIPLLPFLKLDEEAVKAMLTEYAARWDTELTQSSWTLVGDRPDLSTGSFDPEAEGQSLVLTLGIPAAHLDVEQVYGEILAGYDKAIELCASGAFSVTPEVVPEILPEEPDVNAIVQELSAAAVDDSLDLTSFTFVHGSYGYGLEPETVKALVSGAKYGETLRIPLSSCEPEILGEEVYFRDVLGSCETKHTDDENRNTNLRLLCQALDGYIIQPGEEFSYNGVVGERTADRGYKPATAYSGSRMIKDIGGGVCQGSTTLYNCALLADVEILERVCHGAKVGYIKLGLDAAVNWNTKTDLRFRNNFHFPVMIKAEVSDGYVRMQLLGTDEKDYYVEMYCKSGAGEEATYASSYKRKYSKATGELLSDELEARSTYYELS